MKKQIWKSSPLIKIIYNSFFNLPSPSNISIWWNFGSLLGLCLIIQMMTGIFLSMYYIPQADMAFDSIVHICRNVNYGWLLRTLHSNGASIFFICLYIHIGRGIYYSSYNLHQTWMIGTLILIIMMMTAFMGYVLPWNQMSFWGTTVITNLLSAIPYIGKLIIYWLWGSFTISNATLTRFYTFHFILPFVIVGMVMIHLLFLHQTGSNNPLGLNSDIDKVPFHPYYTYKDMLGFIIMLMILTMLVLVNPYLFSDPNTFIPANPMVTPLHIQPEWYFLFAYAILRSVPNKLGGIVALAGSIAMLMIMPFLNKKKMMSTQFYPPNKILFWSFLSIMLLLTWIGKSPVEYPYISIGQFLMMMYFSFFIINPLTYQMWDYLLFKY